jgi:hypothetical protein
VNVHTTIRFLICAAVVPVALPLLMLAQTATTPAAPAAPVVAPTTTASPITLPAYFAVGGEFNQLANPKGAIFVDMVYTTSGQNSIGMVNDTGIDIVPTKKTDPTTGKSFYAITSEVNQCVDEKIIATGKFRLYAGVCGGPGFSSTAAGGINISATGSFKAVATYRLNSFMSVVFPVRMNYITGIGWNPIIEGGISFDLKKLPAPK